MVNGQTMRRLLPGRMLGRPTQGAAVLHRRLPVPAGRRRAFSQTASAGDAGGHGTRSFAAQFVRGGTSNGLVVEEAALPAYAMQGSAAQRLAARAAAWAPVLAPAMGAPDERYGRQLDGMGSGVSSTSKVCVLARAAAEEEGQDHDVAFTFVQVGIRDGRLDVAGNCGNMVSAVGPLAFDRGWGGRAAGDGTATVRIWNTNTGKTIVSRFRVAGAPARFCPDGDYAIDGVAGTHSRITLSFERPAGARTGAASGLPTGRPVDELPLPPGSAWGPSVRASLVDVSNPGVFVLGESLGLGSSVRDSSSTGNDTEADTDDASAELRRAAAAIEADASLRATLEHLRRAGAERMGLDPEAQSVPKIVLLFPGRRPQQQQQQPQQQQQDIRCVALSMGQVHKAAPLTLALCLGASAHMPGTLAEQLVREARGYRPGDSGVTGDRHGNKSTLTIGHPSGSVDVGTTLDPADGTIASAELHRTARVLMEGRVFY